MEEEKQETLGKGEQQKENFAKTLEALKEEKHANEGLRRQLRKAVDMVSMLEHGLEMKTTSTQKIVKENQDSMEIGAQANGRIKVYGDYGNKPEFAKKIKDAIELLQGTRETLEKLNGAE